jgi:Mor family transcriptional regulator
MQRVLRELAGAIGLSDTIELVRRWGGRELRVPVNVTRSDPLALTMGMDSAQRLVKHYGGQRLQLPTERNALLDLRNAAIREEAAAGRSHESIGLRYGLTRQAISHILRTHRDLEAIRQKFAGVGVEQ